MDATAWVAVAGIAATLVGSMVGPLIHEQVRRRSVREEQLRTARMDVYSDLIVAAAKVRDNAMTWSSLPLAELEESDLITSTHWSVEYARSAATRSTG